VNINDLINSIGKLKWRVFKCHGKWNAVDDEGQIRFQSPEWISAYCYAAMAVDGARASEAAAERVTEMIRQINEMWRGFNP